MNDNEFDKWIKAFIAVMIVVVIWAIVMATVTTVKQIEMTDRIVASMGVETDGQ